MSKISGVKGIIKHLNISKSSFYLYIKTGKLPLKKFGGRYITTTERLDEFINSLLKIK